jgi:hypothetical protein
VSHDRRPFITAGELVVLAAWLVVLVLLHCYLSAAPRPFGGY